MSTNDKSKYFKGGKPGPKRDDGRPRSGGERRFAPRSPAERRPDQLWIYGIHAVAAALGNPNRVVLRLLATPNAAARLREEGATLPEAIEEADAKALDRLLGESAVHQGVAVLVEPLDPLPLSLLGDARLVVVLDQVTDPHNVGAILRSAVAFGADALLTTGRHAPAETGVLAKAASGALEWIKVVEVPNLARALDELGELGFHRVGLDSEGTATLEGAMSGERIALVLGAEGKGLRRLSREKCDTVARLDMPGVIKSLNVSNAAALALYVARRHLGVPTT
ncbi:MAG TPA: 23S rRNA (guanosine(2251)-2'-O)-methyltransferase RlmB [Kaistia sp.]|nr:23S rRNA (guanosine(2251)-2'-O)-methyltransferase RlmB [Kaistia sp.]